MYVNYGVTRKVTSAKGIRTPVNIILKFVRRLLAVRQKVKRKEKRQINTL